MERPQAPHTGSAGPSRGSLCPNPQSAGHTGGVLRSSLQLLRFQRMNPEKQTHHHTAALRNSAIPFNTKHANAMRPGNCTPAATLGHGAPFFPAATCNGHRVCALAPRLPGWNTNATATSRHLWQASAQHASARPPYSRRVGVRSKSLLHAGQSQGRGTQGRHGLGATGSSSAQRGQSHRPAEEAHRASCNFLDPPGIHVFTFKQTSDF